MVGANQDFLHIKVNDLEVEEIITQVDINPGGYYGKKTQWEGIERI